MQSQWNDNGSMEDNEMQMHLIAGSSPWWAAVSHQLRVMCTPLFAVAPNQLYSLTSQKIPLPSLAALVSAFVQRIYVNK